MAEGKWDVSSREDFKVYKHLKNKTAAQNNELRKQVERLGKDRKSFLGKFAHEKAKLFRRFNQIKAEKYAVKERSRDVSSQNSNVCVAHLDNSHRRSRLKSLSDEDLFNHGNSNFNEPHRWSDGSLDKFAQEKQTISANGSKSSSPIDITVTKPEESGEEGEFVESCDNDRENLSTFLTSDYTLKDYEDINGRPLSVNDLENLDIPQCLEGERSKSCPTVEQRHDIVNLTSDNKQDQFEGLRYVNSPIKEYGGNNYTVFKTKQRRQGVIVYSLPSALGMNKVNERDLSPNSRLSISLTFNTHNPTSPRKGFIHNSADLKVLSASADSLLKPPPSGTSTPIAWGGQSMTTTENVGTLSPQQRLANPKSNLWVYDSTSDKSSDRHKSPSPTNQRKRAETSPQLHKNKGIETPKSKDKKGLSPACSNPGSSHNINDGVGQSLERRISLAMEKIMTMEDLKSKSVGGKSKEELDFYRRALSGDKLPVSPYEIRQRSNSYSAGDNKQSLTKSPTPLASKARRTKSSNDSTPLLSSRKLQGNKLSKNLDSTSNESVNSSISESKSTPSHSPFHSSEALVSIVVDKAEEIDEGDREEKKKDCEDVDMFVLDDDWKLQAIPFRKRSSTFSGMKSKPICRLPGIVERSPTPDASLHV